MLKKTLNLVVIGILLILVAMLYQSKCEWREACYKSNTDWLMVADDALEISRKLYECYGVTDTTLIVKLKTEIEEFRAALED